MFRSGLLSLSYLPSINGYLMHIGLIANDEISAVGGILKWYLRLLLPHGQVLFNPFTLIMGRANAYYGIFSTGIRLIFN